MTSTQEHTYADEVILELFRRGEYDGQSSRHVTELCNAIAADLIHTNEVVEAGAANGSLVGARNVEIGDHPFVDTLDFAVGRPADTYQNRLSQSPKSFVEESPEDILFGLNVESLISSIRKNFGNRGTEIYTFYMSVYEHRPVAVTAAIVLYNVAVSERPNDDINDLAAFEFASGSLSQKLDALAVIPISYDEDSPSEASLAPDYVPVEHPLAYRNLVDVISNALADRIKGEFEVAPENVDSVLAQTESEIIEFKQRIPQQASTVAKEVVGFANHEGGALIIGATNTGEAVGVDDVDEVEERISNVLSEIDQPVVRSIEKATVDGDDLVVINVVQATQFPASYNGTFYVRQGTRNGKLTGQQIFERFPRNNE